MLLLGVSWLNFLEVNGSWMNGLDDVEQELAIPDGFVFDVFDLMFGWYSAISPLDKSLLVDFSNSLFPIEPAKLPYNSQSQRNPPIDDINASDANDFEVKFTPTQLNNIVAVLDNVNSALEFVRVLVPLDSSWTKPLDNLEQDSTVFQVGH